MGNNFLQRQKIREMEIHNAVRQTYLQFLTDMVQITLNDKDAMGDHAFGEGRIKHFMDVLGENYNQYFPAIQAKDPEADYVRTRLEERMKQIYVSGDYVAFEDRYDFVKDLPKTGSKR